MEALESAEGSQFPLERLTSLLGEEHSQHFPALIHLVVADSAYMNSEVTDKEATDYPAEELCT